VWASDIDPRAVKVARRNVAADRAVVGDLFSGLPQELQAHVDVVVANAPYVPTAELVMMPVEAREHEPRIALDGGADGLDLHRRIASEVGRWLAPGGTVIIESSRRQAAGTAAALAQQGMATRIRHDGEIDGTAVIAHVAKGRPPRDGEAPDRGELA
jgi:release factor glutamine methyltransferase